VGFQNVGGSFIVASKFTAFHLPFCDMAPLLLLLLWSIDKNCRRVFEVPLFNIAVRLYVIT
jgi:hypothetical protein